MFDLDIYFDDDSRAVFEKKSDEVTVGRFG